VRWLFVLADALAFHDPQLTGQVGDGVRDATDELVATVSHRQIPWTSIKVST
jgi:hypothetical protein